MGAAKEIGQKFEALPPPAFSSQFKNRTTFRAFEITGIDHAASNAKFIFCDNASLLALKRGHSWLISFQIMKFYCGPTFTTNSFPANFLSKFRPSPTLTPGPRLARSRSIPLSLLFPVITGPELHSLFSRRQRRFSGRTFSRFRSPFSNPSESLSSHPRWLCQDATSTSRPTDKILAASLWR